MKRIINWFWFDTQDYSIINGEVKFWQKNLLTGYGRLKDTFSGSIILEL